MSKKKYPTTQESFDEAMATLEEVRNKMMFLASFSDDWTAKVQLDEEFASLKQAMRDFGRHQLGVKLK